MIVAAVSGLIFTVLAILGGMAAFSRFVRGYTGLKLIELPWAGLFGLALAFSAFFFAVSVKYASGTVALLLAALIPFAILGTTMWFFAFLLELFFRASGSRGMRVEPTYDVGDGLMVRQQFADAEAAFRKSLQEDPLDLGALLRISRAQVADGRVEDAVRELDAARRHAMAHREQAKAPMPESMRRLQEKEFRQDRILRLTFALGDLYVEKRGDSERARELYEETLQILYGYPAVDPLRARLAALNRADYIPLADAVQKAQPRTISLDGEQF